MRIAVQVDGFDDALRRLERFGQDVEKRQVRSLRAGGNVLRDGMRAEVPVSEIDHKHIKDDIKVRQTPKKDRSIPNAVSFDIGPGKETAWRAKFVHNGYVAKNGRFVRGNPFAVRAYRLKRVAINQAVMNEMRKGARS